ncbi:MAG: PAS domain-containing sensor histidine kinase [Sneathiellaceae bacterium]
MTAPDGSIATGGHPQAHRDRPVWSAGLTALAGLAAGLLYGLAAWLLGDQAAFAAALPAIAIEMAKGLALALAVWLLLHRLARARIGRIRRRLRRIAGSAGLPPAANGPGIDGLASLESDMVLLLRQYQRNSIQARARARMIDLLVDAAPDGIIALRPDHTILRVNRACAELFGYRPEELAGRPLDLLLPEGQRAEHRRAIDRFARLPDSGAVIEANRLVTGLHRDGTELPVAASIGKASLRGTMVLFAILRDLSALERARLEAETAAAKAQAAAQKAALADRSKTEFLANMSHELRTPLNGVIGLAEMMELETFGPLGHAKYREYVGDIQAAGGQLLAILSDILDVSRLDLDGGPAARRPIDLAPLVRGVARAFRERLPAGVTIDLHGFHTAIPALAEERPVRQVLLNLIANASRFVDQEGGLIDLRAISTPAGHGGANDRGMTGFEIRDSGPGFSSDVLEHFGSPFNVGSDSRLSGTGSGNGLGLYICKRIMDGQKGRIVLSNDRGAVVTVLFEPAGEPATD